MPISYNARRDLIQQIISYSLNWKGILNDLEFLSRVYDLNRIPSTDGRFKTANQDIWQHTVNNPGDWDDYWVFRDERFDLHGCPDDVFLRFLCEMINPIVRPDESERLQFLELFNSQLRAEGYEIVERQTAFGQVVYEASGPISGTLSAIQQIRDQPITLNSEYIQRQIGRMMSSVNDDPELAIGTAKEFVETISKTILGQKGVQLTGNEDLPRLVRMTLEHIGALGSKDPRMNEITRKTIGSLTTLGQCIGELRNLHGTGHGRDATVATIESRYAILAVNSAATIALFIFQSYEK